MKIAKSVNEKITFKDVTGAFHSREFGAFREVSVPDNSPDELIRLTETQLQYDLRVQVLAAFVMEGVMTSDAMATTLQPHKDMLEQVEKEYSTVLKSPNT